MLELHACNLKSGSVELKQRRNGHPKQVTSGRVDGAQGGDTLPFPQQQCRLELRHGRTGDLILKRKDATDKPVKSARPYHFPSGAQVEQASDYAKPFSALLDGSFEQEVKAKGGP